MSFGEDPPDVDPDGPKPTFQCSVEPTRVTASGRYTSGAGIRWQYTLDLQDPGAEDRLSLVVRRDNTDHAWVTSFLPDFADAIDEIDVAGNTLTVSGQLYVNDPARPGLSPVAALPDDADLTPFTLSTTCHQ